MISIPSYEGESAMEEVKGMDNSSLTTHSSLSNSGSGDSIAVGKKSDPSNKIDWLNVEDSVLGWFVTR
jgi:hypothetical protein